MEQRLEDAATSPGAPRAAGPPEPERTGRTVRWSPRGSVAHPWIGACGPSAARCVCWDLLTALPRGGIFLSFIYFIFSNILKTFRTVLGLRDGARQRASPPPSPHPHTCLPRELSQGLLCLAPPASA